MKIEVHLLSQSQPMTYVKVKNAYTKDGMYCLLLEDGSYTKFPMVNIFRVKEFDEVVESKEIIKFDLVLDGETHLENKNIFFLTREEFNKVLSVNDIEPDEDMNCFYNDDLMFIADGN